MSDPQKPQKPQDSSPHQSNQQNQPSQPQRLNPPQEQGQPPSQAQSESPRSTQRLEPEQTQQGQPVTPAGLEQLNGAQLLQLLTQAMQSGIQQGIQEGIRLVQEDQPQSRKRRRDPELDADPGEFELPEDADDIERLPNGEPRPGSYRGQGRMGQKIPYEIRHLEAQEKKMIFPLKDQTIRFNGVGYRVVGGRPVMVPGVIAEIYENSQQEWAYWEDWKRKYFGDTNSMGTGGHFGSYKSGGGWAPDESGDPGPDDAGEAAA